METITILQIIWFFLVGILISGYAVLDGFDLGTGVLLPFLAGTDQKKTEQVLKTIGPVWDGNEVWLITAGGALFAAFPHAYATVFSGFYLALMFVLFGLILRAVSIEFFILEPAKKKVWMWTFFTGSLIPSLLFGIALGNVILGIPLDSAMEYRGSFFTLLRPFPVCIGLLGFSAILLQGAAYVALKTDGEVHDTAKKFSQKIWYIHIMMFILSIAASFIYIPDKMNNIPAWISAVIFILLLVFLRVNTGLNDLKRFLLSSASFICLLAIAGAVHFPLLVKSICTPAYDITIFNASSGKLTLSVMLGIAIIGMPIVIGYSIYVYRIFKGKTSI